MQKIVIFDGPDGSGKTAIAKAFAALSGVPYFKNTSEHGCFEAGSTGLLTRYGGVMMLSFLQQTGHSAIFDRSYPAEFAYAKAFGRHLDMDVLTHLDEGHAALKSLIVYCYKTNYGDFCDSLIRREKYVELKSAYSEFLDWTKCQFMILDTTSENLSYQLDSVSRFCDHYWNRVM